MNRATWTYRRCKCLIICGILLARPFSLLAQETIQQQQEEQPGKMSTPGVRGPGLPLDTATEMQKMHKQMKKMRQEMTQELQKQMTALRAHAQAMEGISDEKQLLAEMKKHLQMIDEFLGTMVEQRATLDAGRKERHEQIWNRLGKTHQIEKNEPEEHEGHRGTE